MKDKIIQFFSNLGRSLMMPIAALAACRIVLGLTSALSKAQVVAAVPFLGFAAVKFVILALYKLSAVVFTLIPVLFAISISLGLAKEDKEIAAFAGFLGYYAFLVGSSLVIATEVIDFSAMKISTILGVQTLDMGAIAGIIIGLLTAHLHNKYHKVEFPAAIAFYGGKRFVALIVILCSGILGLVMPFIWAPVSSGINALGGLIAGSGSFGVFIYGLLERLLIPTGLHHVLNGLFRTTALGGVYEGVEGCLNIFLQFIDKVQISDLAQFTKFLGQGKMPYMMFGLPAAAYAIYKTTPQEKKGKVKALMIAGVAASAISGITEPLEFSFMLMSLLGVVIGNTGGGLIDFFIWGVFQPGSNWYWVIVVGVCYAAIYYFVFYSYLKKKNISIDVSVDDDSEVNEQTIPDNELFNTARTIISGLGGIENIVAVNNCMSRLRVDVKDMSKVDDNVLKSTGSIGIIKPTEKHIQVIYGPKVEKIADKVRELLKY